jgi:hypothetical protein
LPNELTEGADYTIDESGKFIFTADFLLRRGECCGNGCRNCPYRGKPLSTQETSADHDI